MRDNHNRRKALSTTGMLSPNAERQARITQAARLLSALSDRRLDAVVWRRAHGLTDGAGLPVMTLDEGPTDILIDVVQYGNHQLLRDRLRTGSRRLLERFNRKPILADASAAAELCFFAARVGATEAIPPLTALAWREARRPTALPSSVTLYKRALQSLGGLLIDHRDAVEGDKHRSVFEKGLATPGCELICLTALITLWPASRKDFYKRLPLGYHVDEEALNASLSIAELGATGAAQTAGAD